ncbi:MAG: NDP-sugar synthase [Candidatus Hatepunaea meridiana]|nr:NDP-sugar synthase [Candidatus Hatepunaea meridiana]
MKDHSIHSAIVLTAGYGKRLKPLTNFVPKALFPIANKPALSQIIQKLKDVSVSDFYFNMFHLSDQVIDYLNRQSDVNKTIVKEKTLRNTGGGIANFREMLFDKAFIIHNCDVYCEEDLSNLVEYHLRQDALATLMVVDFPAINSVVVKDGILIRCQSTAVDSSAAKYTYTGIAVFSPAIWKYFPTEEVFPLIPVLEKVMQNGEKIAAYNSTAYWNDIGTPQRYWELHRYLAGQGNGSIDETAIIKNCTLKGFNFIGESATVYNSQLKNCIVFPRVKVINESLENCIIQADCRVVV